MERAVQKYFVNLTIDTSCINSLGNLNLRNRDEREVRERRKKNEGEAEKEKGWKIGKHS